jgi:hypothetical protein
MPDQIAKRNADLPTLGAALYDLWKQLFDAFAPRNCAEI